MPTKKDVLKGRNAPAPEQTNDYRTSKGVAKPRRGTKQVAPKLIPKKGYMPKGQP